MFANPMKVGVPNSGHSNMLINSDPRGGTRMNVVNPTRPGHRNARTTKPPLSRILFVRNLVACGALDGRISDPANTAVSSETTVFGVREGTISGYCPTDF